MQPNKANQVRSEDPVRQADVVLLPNRRVKPEDQLQAVQQDMLKRIRELLPLIDEYEKLRELVKDALVRGLVPEDGPLKAYLRPKKRGAYSVKACTYFELVVE